MKAYEEAAFVIQSNLDYRDLDYPDFSVIRSNLGYPDFSVIRNFRLSGIFGYPGFSVIRNFLVIRNFQFCPKFRSLCIIIDIHVFDYPDPRLSGLV